MNFSFAPNKMDIYNILDRTPQLDQEASREHENGILNLSRIHIGLKHTEDRIIKYIYLKDNTFYSLGDNIVKWLERSHTESQENTH